MMNKLLIGKSKIKHVGKSAIYRYVYIKEADGIRLYEAKIGKFCNVYTHEKDAAKAIDLYLIRKRRKPVNILKKVN